MSPRSAGCWAQTSTLFGFGTPRIRKDPLAKGAKLRGERRIAVLRSDCIETLACAADTLALREEFHKHATLRDDAAKGHGGEDDGGKHKQTVLSDEVRREDIRVGDAVDGRIDLGQSDLRTVSAERNKRDDVPASWRSGPR